MYMADRIRPNIKKEVKEELDQTLLELGYPETAIEDAGHGQKVMWLIKEARQ